MEGAAEGGWRGPLMVSSKKVFACNQHTCTGTKRQVLYSPSMSLSLAAPRPIQSNDKQRHTLFCVEPFELLSHTQPCGKPHAHT